MLCVGHNMYWETLKEKNLLERFMKKNCERQTKQSLGDKKVTKKKDDRLYDKWKTYDNSFSSWIDEKLDKTTY